VKREAGGRLPWFVCAVGEVRRPVWLFAPAVLAAVAACAPALAPGAAPTPAAPAVATDSVADRLRPTRSGALGQDQISVRTTAGALMIEVTPLDDWVLDATAPDARARLVRIRDEHGREAARRAGIRDPALFLVSFSSAPTAADFQPEDLHLIARGLRERPLAILPLSPAWGSHRLEPQTSAAALYAYDEIDVKRDFVVAYQGHEDHSWARKAPAIEAERNRISGERDPALPPASHGLRIKLPAVRAPEPSSAGIPPRACTRCR